MAKFVASVHKTADQQWPCQHEKCQRNDATHANNVFRSGAQLIVALASATMSFWQTELFF